MNDRIEKNGDYFKNAARMIGDKTRPDRMTATMQTVSKRGSIRMIRSSQFDFSINRLNRRTSLVGLRG
jgi:hypothetical protein